MLFSGFYFVRSFQVMSLVSYPTHEHPHTIFFFFFFY
jgi:hypothetical protein